MPNKEFENAAFPVNTRTTVSAPEAEANSAAILHTLKRALNGPLAFNAVAPAATFSADSAMLDGVSAHVAVTPTHTVEVVQMAPAQAAPHAYISIYDNNHAGEKGTVNIWAKASGELDVSVVGDKHARKAFHHAVHHGKRDAVVNLTEKLINTVTAAVPTFNK